MKNCVLLFCCIIPLSYARAQQFSGSATTTGVIERQGKIKINSTAFDDHLEISRQGWGGVFKPDQSAGYQGLRLDLIGTGSNFYVLNGKVGIGTSTPGSSLEVNGGFKAGKISTNPSINDHAVIRSSGTTAYDGGLVFTNTQFETGYGIKFSTVNSNSVNPGLRIGVISLTTPNTYNKDYLYLANEKVGVGTIDPSSKIHVHSGNSSSIMKFQRDGANTYEFQISGTIFGLYDLTSSSYKWRTNGTNLALLENGGNVGIGTAAPQTLLSLKSKAPGELLSLSASNSNAYLKLGVDVDYSWIQSYGSRSLYINDIGNNTIINRQGGSVAIGTNFTNNYKLAVNGVIGAREVNVNSEEWADYVFEQDYKLMPLAELESYIKENKHLPEIPSTEDVKESGIALGQMNTLLLKKIEELTLHVIDLNQRNERLEEQNATLEKEYNELRLEVSKITLLQAEMEAIKELLKK